jgi:hypothetical protein
MDDDARSDNHEFGDIAELEELNEGGKSPPRISLKL